LKLLFQLWGEFQQLLFPCKAVLLSEMETFSTKIMSFII
jgi:hypothetical protein